MSNVVEVDVFIKTEDNMCGDEKKKKKGESLTLYRGLRQWHDTRWKLCELGRSDVFFR